MPRKPPKLKTAYHLAASFIDHHAFNTADFSAVGTVHGCALNLVAANQTTRFAILHSHCSLRSKSFGMNPDAVTIISVSNEARLQGFSEGCLMTSI